MLAYRLIDSVSVYPAACWVSLLLANNAPLMHHSGSTTVKTEGEGNDELKGVSVRGQNTRASTKHAIRGSGGG